MKNHHIIETFVEAVKNNVENILQEKELPRNNLSKSDKAAIDYFTKREDIVITKADEALRVSINWTKKKNVLCKDC